VEHSKRQANSATKSARTLARSRLSCFAPAAMKIVVAYSGGLDTSVLLKWLKAKYNAEIIAYCADVGQGADVTWVVLADPEGNEFCVLSPRP
jgi:tRNA(Ile)-lysidine synthase TilS/MesJ